MWDVHEADVKDEELKSESDDTETEVSVVGCPCESFTTGNVLAEGEKPNTEDANEEVYWKEQA